MFRDCSDSDSNVTHKSETKRSQPSQWQLMADFGIGTRKITKRDPRNMTHGHAICPHWGTQLAQIACHITPAQQWHDMQSAQTECDTQFAQFLRGSSMTFPAREGKGGRMRGSSMTCKTQLAQFACQNILRLTYVCANTGSRKTTDGAQKRHRLDINEKPIGHRRTPVGRPTQIRFV